ncbi:MAG: hypothetical protein ABI721_01860 [Candidatus Dojkabacteria bacterium]
MPDDADNIENLSNRPQPGVDPIVIGRAIGLLNQDGSHMHKKITVDEKMSEKIEDRMKAIRRKIRVGGWDLLDEINPQEGARRKELKEKSNNEGLTKAEQGELSTLTEKSNSLGIKALSHAELYFWVTLNSFLGFKFNTHSREAIAKELKNPSVSRVEDLVEDFIRHLDLISLVRGLRDAEEQGGVAGVIDTLRPEPPVPGEYPDDEDDSGDMSEPII